MTSALGLIGTGRVAGALALLLRKQGHPFAAVAGRSSQRAAAIAGDATITTIQDIAALTPHLVIAVKDDAIESVVAQLLASQTSPAIVLHTAGAAGPEALQPLRARGAATGVLHPLQTFPNAQAGCEALPGSSWAYAGDAGAEGLASQLIRLLGGHPLHISRQRWLFYHAAAVLASNYQVALVDAALELMQGAGIARDEALRALTPILTQTHQNVVASGPEHALTGPIQRGDAGTVLRHIQALRAATPEIRNLYTAAGWQTLHLAARSGLDPVHVDEVAKALARANTQ